MREIKFRAWDKENKEFVYLVLCDGKFLYPIPEDEERNKQMEITEFTGLKDKNGKEIWEGDIVRDNEKGINYEVGFMQGMFAVACADGRWHGLYEFQKIVSSLKAGSILFEVIGNIYENPYIIS
jgi:uncharacterized phage protein (TIGR01671 family)